MHPRILSQLEEQQIRAYLKQDGHKTLNVRVVATRAKQFIPQIRKDLLLLETFLETYSKETK